MEITQGNIVTSKMLSQLKPGMSKSQVKFIVGTPLIQDMFHKDRWDYFLQQIVDGKIIEQRRVIIDFKDDKLINVGGDVIPITKGDVTDPSTNVATGYKFTKEDPQVIVRNPLITTAKADKSSWTDSIMFWKDNKTEADKAALKKQIEAHNQSLLDKNAEARVSAENSAVAPAKPIAVPAAIVATSVDTTSMGKAPENTVVKEDKGFWNNLKFWGKAAPAVVTPIAGAASATPQTIPAPVVTITKAAEIAETQSAEVQSTASMPTEIKANEISNATREQTTIEQLKSTETPQIATAPVETIVEPAIAAAVPPTSATPMKQDEKQNLVQGAIEDTTHTPTLETTYKTEAQATDGLRLSERLNNHVDLPLVNPFTGTPPEPLGLQLTSLLATASQNLLEQSVLEANNKSLQSEIAAEKSKETPGFFERMLERVGF